MRKTGLAVLGAATLAGVLWFGAGNLLVAHGAEHEGTGLLPAPGATCVVYLRGDASGVAYHDRIADLGILINKKGTVIRADDTWLVLEDGEHKVYIPRTSIMLIETAK